MSVSITLHENMGSNPLWNNPNVYPGDASGNPVTPQHGVPCHLWGRVQNTGSEQAQALEVSFFLCIPTTSTLYWPQAAHGSGALTTLPAGQTQGIMCSVPWIPDSTQGSHQCIAAAVGCLDCPVPPTSPGTPVDPANTQIGLHNVTLTHLSAGQQTVERPFNIINPPHPGYVQVSRDPLPANAALLSRYGIDPGIMEAPQDEKISIVSQTDGQGKGQKLNFNAGESHALYAKVELGNTSPGAAAIYHVRHYENDELKGGVSLIILH